MQKPETYWLASQSKEHYIKVSATICFVANEDETSSAWYQRSSRSSHDDRNECELYPIEAPSAELPSVSVLVPAKNEAQSIRSCVQSLLSQDYPSQRYEIIVIDDSSTDATPEVVQELRKKHTNLLLVKNTGKGTADARNTGLSVARGDVIVNFSSHAVAESRYLTTIVRKLKDADNTIAGVGCRHEIPPDDRFLAKLFGLAIRSPLGAMGTSYAQPEKEQLRDSIAFTAYRRDVFKKVGLFDNRFTEIDDGEFNFRLRRAGYRLLYTPSVVVFHRQPSTVSGFVRKMLTFGRGRAKLARKDPASFRILYTLPTGLVIAVLLFVLASVVAQNFLILLLPMIVYYAASLIASARLAVKVCPKCLPLVPIAQFFMHFAYGVGFVTGL